MSKTRDAVLLLLCACLPGLLQPVVAAASSDVSDAEELIRRSTPEGMDYRQSGLWDACRFARDDARALARLFEEMACAASVTTRELAAAQLARTLERIRARRLLSRVEQHARGLSRESRRFYEVYYDCFDEFFSALLATGEGMAGPLETLDSNARQLRGERDDRQAGVVAQPVDDMQRYSCEAARYRRAELERVTSRAGIPSSMPAGQCLVHPPEAFHAPAWLVPLVRASRDVESETSMPLLERAVTVFWAQESLRDADLASYQNAGESQAFTGATLVLAGPALRAVTTAGTASVATEVVAPATRPALRLIVSRPTAAVSAGAGASARPLLAAAEAPASPDARALTESVTALGNGRVRAVVRAEPGSTELLTVELHEDAFCSAANAPGAPGRSGPCNPLCGRWYTRAHPGVVCGH